MAELFNKDSPSTEPQAELWMGVHPKAPSQASFEGRWVPLPDLISRWPHEILGSDVAERFDGQLPYLFKILAPEAPLSIQVHPNRAQARLGYMREERVGMAMDAFERNYRDDNHKPEIICALSDFWLLCSFRPFVEISEYFQSVTVAGLSQRLMQLVEQPHENRLRPFFEKLLSLSEAELTAVAGRVTKGVEERSGHTPETEWIRDLAERYPGDAGILSPLLLNLVKLAPGEAIFLQPGELHAYLHGLGVELMANSDNVLRAGLTSKHLDIPELLKAASFVEKQASVIVPVRRITGELEYLTPAEEFSLASIVVSPENHFTSAANRHVEILICTTGQATIHELERAETIELTSGTSVLVPASIPRYCLEGDATLYRATVP